MRRFGYFSGCWLRSFCTALLCKLMVTTPAPVYAAAGDLDPTFEDGSKVITDFGSENVTNALAPTGGIVTGRAWHDANQNYQIDDDEIGIASLPIKLTIGYSLPDCINRL